MKKIICLTLALVMMLAMGIEAFAWVLPEVSVNGTYSGGKITSLSAEVDWTGLGPINGHLVLMTKYLTTPPTEPGSLSTGYGDFTDQGDLYGDYSSIDEVAADTALGVIKHTPAVYLSGSNNTLSIDLSTVDLSEGIYYVYLWASGYSTYPDFLVAAIKVESDGTVKYSPVKENSRNTYDSNENAFQEVTERKDYKITVAPTSNGSVSVHNSADEGDNVALTITPDDGFEVDTVKVEAAGSTTEVTVTNNAFTMPASDVTVTVTFKQTLVPLPNNPAPTPSEPEEIVINITGNQKEETEEANPNTGAPVFVPAVIVLASAAAIIRRK